MWVLILFLSQPINIKWFATEDSCRTAGRAFNEEQIEPKRFINSPIAFKCIKVDRWPPTQDGSLH